MRLNLCFFEFFCFQVKTSATERGRGSRGCEFGAEQSAGGGHGRGPGDGPRRTAHYGRTSLLHTRCSSCRFSSRHAYSEYCAEANKWLKIYLGFHNESLPSTYHR